VAIATSSTYCKQCNEHSRLVSDGIHTGICFAGWIGVAVGDLITVKRLTRFKVVRSGFHLSVCRCCIVSPHSIRCSHGKETLSASAAGRPDSTKAEGWVLQNNRGRTLECRRQSPHLYHSSRLHSMVVTRTKDAASTGPCR
jgi:hypothetical protein